MFRLPFQSSNLSPKDQLSITKSNSLNYSWIIRHKFAIGPMPRTLFHWNQLENDSFLNRFSCCYPDEHIFTPIPPHWKSNEVSLPDHRSQEVLERNTLLLALQKALGMIESSEYPLYVHCFAGKERSVLLGVGLVCILKNKNVFDSLNYVRECHRISKPLYEHLALLDEIIDNKPELGYNL